MYFSVPGAMMRPQVSRGSGSRFNSQRGGGDSQSSGPRHPPGSAAFKAAQAKQRQELLQHAQSFLNPGNMPKPAASSTPSSTPAATPPSASPVAPPTTEKKPENKGKEEKKPEEKKKEEKK